MLDIGGTTTDVGVLQGGFPRPASSEAVLAGVRVNQRGPDILSIGTELSSALKPRQLPSDDVCSGSCCCVQGLEEAALCDLQVADAQLVQTVSAVH